MFFLEEWKKETTFELLKCYKTEKLTLKTPNFMSKINRKKQVQLLKNTVKRIHFVI